jgi:LysR family transcriptional regulator, cell division regulator
MESHDLRIFRTVAYSGSVTKAAQQLGYVQSNITARIQQLEEELKTPLFYRHRGMLLTRKGELLLQYTERILHFLDEANKSLVNSDETGGELAIGANQTFSTINLPEILGKFHKSFPNVALSLITGQPDDLVEKVLHFQLDTAFITIPVQHENLVKELISEERLVLIASSAIATVEEVYTQSFLMNPPNCPCRMQLEKWLKDNGVNNARFMEFNNIDAIIHGVIAGLGVAFVPESMIRKHEMAGTLKSFAVPVEYSLSQTFLIRHKEVLMTNAFKEFIAMVKM